MMVASAVSSPQSKPPLLRVAIVGAGMAGIKVAHDLCANAAATTNLQVTILEANSYIGGRMCHDTFQGQTVELGANWISGLDGVYDNPVWTKLAQDAGLQTLPSNRQDKDSLLALDAATGRDVTDDYLATVARFDDAYQRAVDTCAQRKIQPSNDVTVQSLLQECGWKPGSSSLERTVQYNVLDVWVANRLDCLSAAHDLKVGANDVELGKEEVFVQDERGFNCVLQSMVRDIQDEFGNDCIHLNTQVESIQYSPNNVMVTSKDLTSSSSSGSGQFVATHAADVVVCTVSLGVLQSNKIDFRPPLPTWKKAALSELGMYVFAKVFCRFEKAFQPGKGQFAICSEQIGHYPFWVKCKSIEASSAAGDNEDKNLYMCYLGGKEAERVEALSESEIQTEIQELLQRAFSNTHLGIEQPSIFRPTAVAVTNWSQNPRFCGSYSYFPVHAFSDIPEADLRDALTGTAERDGPKTLYFAGEAFDDKFNGWVQGAYRTGERVAKSLFNDKRLQH